MQHHVHTWAIALAAAILAANLPDPHQPTIILIIAGLGALVGTTIRPDPPAATRTDP